MTPRIAVDAMGGDSAPASVVEGAQQAADQLSTTPHIVLVGSPEQIDNEFERIGKRSSSIEVRAAAEVVEMGEHPGQAIRHKKDSSLRVCFELMARGEVDAVVSAGNSGAMMAGALLITGRLPGVERPAIGAVLPNQGERSLLVDAGANATCKPLHLAQFALMGEVYARRMLGLANPRFGVISNGEEDTKGTDLTRAVAAALRRRAGGFSGYAESKDLFNGEVDIGVCDGFVGNLILKAAEGVAQALMNGMRAAIRRDAMASVGMLMARGALRRFRDTVDWEAVGGAPLIGVKGVGIVAHGRSSPRAIRNAVRIAAEAVAVGMERELSEAAEAARGLFTSTDAA